MGKAFCIGVPNFMQIGHHTAELRRHIDFLRCRPTAILDFVWVILDHRRSAIVSRLLVYKFGVDWIFSFGDIAILKFRRFSSELPIHFVISAAHCAELRVNILPGCKLPLIGIGGGRLSYSTSNFQRCDFSNKGCLLV